MIDFLIVSEKKETKSYFISYKRFIIYSVLYIFLFLMIIGSVVYFNYSLKLSRMEYKSLRNNLHRNMLDADNEMEVMRRYMEKINLMVEYDDTIVEKSEKYGIGGGDEGLLNDELNYVNSEITISNLSNKKESIFEKLENLENELDNLVLNLQNMVVRLNSAPSILPVTGIITSGFGYRKSPFTGRRELHRGVDILNEDGTPIISTADGVVKELSFNSLWGENILISHTNDIETQYGHLKEIKVKVGQEVKRGDIIATLGRSGRATGPHLHYQILVKGTPVDPIDYIIEENFGDIK